MDNFTPKPLGGSENQIMKHFTFFRELLTIILRNPVCPLDGLLPNSDLHPLFSHRRHLVGLFLAQPGCNTSKGVTWGDHRAHHDHPNWNNKLPTAKDLLSQVY